MWRYVITLQCYLLKKKNLIMDGKRRVDWEGLGILS